MKKIVICLISFLLLTGCSANVNLNINGDNSIDETITANESRAIVGSQSPEKYIKNILDENFSSSELSDYNVENIIDSNNIGVKFSRKNSNDICLSIKRSSLKYLSKNISCTLEDDTYSLTFIPDYLICKDDCYFKPEVNSVSVRITLPDGAIYDNSNNKEGNTYIWNFNGQADEKLDLKFIIDKNKLKNDVNESKVDNRETILIALGLILIVAVITLVSISLYKKYKSRKIEY